MIRVVMFSRFPEDVNKPRGGVETATLGLMRGLQALGTVELHLVTLEKGRSEAVVESSLGATIHRLPAPGWPMFIDLLVGPGKRLLKQYILDLKPDIVHFQETYGLGASGYAVPVVFTVHGFDSLNLVTEQSWMWWIRSKIWRRVEGFGLSRQSAIVSITPYVNDEIASRTRSKIYDIENAIAEKYFVLEHREEPGRIFYAGWINPRKNLATLVRTVAELKQRGVAVKLYAAGEASDAEYHRLVLQTIDDLGVADEVVMLGRVGQDEIMNQLAKAALFVLPSLQENAPMAIAEAMATGVPVISSNVCGMPYMIEEGRTGYLVEPNDYRAYADRIEALVGDDTLRQTFSSAAKEEARRRYHPESVAAKTVDLYQTLIAQQA
ncbi:MAG: glycosyltransferase family 4 protein [Candidatus Thiodiazotropha sp.]